MNYLCFLSKYLEKEKLNNVNILKFVKICQLDFMNFIIFLIGILLDILLLNEHGCFIFKLLNNSNMNKRKMSRISHLHGKYEKESII
ncbi:hypothetical protein PFAG_03635 [Plasmodium falciparum Santa Lucia]|uniref:Uncharacterized protein n=5 Tax=Plasmodium falciparum TaxID=5833 RepID=A0A024X4W3_PLAFC|nr:hypothetical protein PFFVO_03262 [Plasmodium falciparum Vietnam Oak-Knoll (FVO)]ETW41647.1 hypothetical protein PFNF135_03802 [Plasmodium falciparum NF135/5.C10]ETW60534.1 hypothetical protein PFMC_03573 [Plasmodium falciparum CAMP/Malaysia]EUT82886.1 hypothetical protein PFAG_03635 [Plasmodium falciparum Santa Lucia]EWC75576.1 hypothetical protein C923_03728 [Plasmodium falciparum UGT5.1]